VLLGEGAILGVGEHLMHENHTTIREGVPAADIRAGDWILPPDDEDQGIPEQLLWRFGHRSPSGEFGWSFKTTAGVRHFDQDATVYRVASAEPPDAGAVDVVEDEASLDVVHALAEAEEHSAEVQLIRAVFVGVAVSIPVFVVIWVGLVALAVGDKDPDWAVWLGMAALIGILNGVFFGALGAFVTHAHVLDDVDRHATQMVESARAHRTDTHPSSSGP
jgi:hypothetical protein